MSKAPSWVGLLVAIGAAIGTVAHALPSDIGIYVAAGAAALAAFGSSIAAQEAGS